MNGRLFCLLAALGIAAGTRAAPAPPAAPAQSAPSSDDLYDLGRQLFEDYAPPDVKAQWEYPTRAQFDAFVQRLQAALQGGSLQDLAALRDDAQQALAALRLIPGAEDYADWLQERLDYIDAAYQLTHPAPPSVAPAPAEPRFAAALPDYGLWLARVRRRPEPAGARELLPKLRAAFAAEGVPPDFAWLAEVESSFNPDARSPAGARGLFQLMPATAERYGLSLFPFDQRVNPEKSAHAAARALRALHAQFGSWPLALAAYNAGAGRVSRALAARHATMFAAIASALPVETRLYVPRVYATIAVREGAPPAGLLAAFFPAAGWRATAADFLRQRNVSGYF